MTRYEELLALPPRPFGGLLAERHGGPPVPGVLSSIDSVFMLCSHGLMGHVEDELPFRVEQWVASGAGANVFSVGRPGAAFAEAVRQRPAQRIVLRHKTRVIEEYKQ